MKNVKINVAKKRSLFAIALIVTAVIPVYAQQLGTPTQLQKTLNELPAIPIAGKNLKFLFGGSNWIATANGENVLAGTVETVDINGGSILTLKQTHVWAGAAGNAVAGRLGPFGKAVSSATNTWVATSGPEMILDYNNSGQRATLSKASEERIAEARTAGADIEE